MSDDAMWTQITVVRVFGLFNSDGQLVMLGATREACERHLAELARATIADWHRQGIGLSCNEEWFRQLHDIRELEVVR